ncbi:putative carbonic anhydrase 3 [Musca autumnalis]|uniref:putative carbonic anhydrase 3 n=1 Tax=Musca autumnalis TaxID=221902 RepID=UPI003CF90761
MLRVWFLLIYICSVVAWNFKEQDKWAKLYPSCGSAKRQSPIAFHTNEALLKITPVMKFSNYEVTHKASINNNGHGIEVRLKGAVNKPTITGGPVPLGASYEFDNVHFHWGVDDSEGAEHWVNGKQYAAEVHAVHYNTKYSDINEALENPDGVVVVTAFYRTDASKLSSALRNISAAVPPLPNSHFKLENFQLANLFGGLANLNKGSFYSYLGSLTTPPCSEAVTWIIYDKPLDINPQELVLFRFVLDEHGQLLENSYRQLQKLNGRKVYFVQY